GELGMERKTRKERVSNAPSFRRGRGRGRALKRNPRRITRFRKGGPGKAKLLSLHIEKLPSHGRRYNNCRRRRGMGVDKKAQARLTHPGGLVREMAPKHISK